VGPGALPVGDHRRRPPIPIVPIDARASAAARARGAGDAVAWAAGVTGADPPAVRLRAVVAGDAGAVARGGSSGVVTIGPSLVPTRDITRTAAMSAGEVALAVDAGREIAARAAADGVTVLLLATTGPPLPHDSVAAGALAAALANAEAGPDAATALALHGDEIGPARPLGALRRLGSPAIAVLCGVALGAGERGLGCVCDGVVASAAAAVAVAVEPGLRARLIVARPGAGPVAMALLQHLGTGVVLSDAAPDGDLAAAVTAALIEPTGD
jgi:nicotinate-nucleotide--dimethylbenzimidazole phosphoribosyltransferase